MSKIITVMLSSLLAIACLEPFPSWRPSPAMALTPPEGEENLPPSQGSGGGRSPESTIISLLPQSAYIGTGHPTFFIYLPQAQGKKVFFSLQDADWNPYYSETLEVLENDVLVAISIPKHLPELEKHKDYRWSFTLFDDVMTPNSHRITGIVKRLGAQKSNHQANNF